MKVFLEKGLIHCGNYTVVLIKGLINIRLVCLCKYVYIGLYYICLLFVLM